MEWGNKIKKHIGEEDAKQKIDNVLNEFKSYIEGAVKIENYDVSEYIHNNYLSFFEEVLNLVVPEMRNFTEEKEDFWDLISKYFNLSLEREIRNKSGVFFAGYGRDDAFPKSIHIEIYAVVNGKLKFSLVEKFEESSSGAQIVPLAQSEVIMTFCQGISEYFINYIPQKVDEIISKKIVVLQSIYSETQITSIKECFKDCKQEIFDIIQASARDKNINPLLSSVQLIPIPEMARLAENLVNITSLKRTFALDGKQQTVGGPTDVAVISKAEGFVWVKKKRI